MKQADRIYYYQLTYICKNVHNTDILPALVTYLHATLSV